jgi:16S rRNA (guanine966-N2)-methyltransferase
MGKIRIIGGQHRSRQLVVLDALGLRPTLTRVKETLFNWLGQDLSGLCCLDLFSGSGSLAFEALSRNAQQVTLVECNPKVGAQLKHNLQLLKVNNAELIIGDALDYLPSCQKKYDIVFIDPPYQGNLLASSLGLIAPVIAQNGVIFIENYKAIDLSAFHILKHGTAGKVNYGIIQLRN